MTNTNQRISEIWDQFREYLSSREVEVHLEIIRREKIEVKKLMNRLSLMDKESAEFTDWILYGLLPYSKTKWLKE